MAGSRLDPPGADRHLELVRQARRGDELAFNRLIDLYHRQVYKMIYYRIKETMEAEDLAQEVFLQAFRSIGKLRSAATFRPWLFRIAINRVKDYRRRKRWLSLFGLFGQEDDLTAESRIALHNPEGPVQLERKQFWQQVDRLISPLSPTEQEVFRLRFFDQLSINEIGHVLNKPDNTIKTHLYRALRKVKASPFLERLAEVAP